jgi:hypothetical protein
METRSRNDLNCPMCFKEYVARVARVGFVEKILSLFYVYPFKCQLCGCRFKALQRGVRYSRVEEDRREYERLPASFPVSFVSGGSQGRGMVSEISMSGCTFQPDGEASQPKEGSVLLMVLQIPNAAEAVNVEGVVRNLQQHHVGVEFLRFPPQDRERLQHYVRDLLARRDAEGRKSEHHAAASVRA